MDKVGVPIYDIARDGSLIPNHHLGNLLGQYASDHCISLDTIQAQSYAEYKDLTLTEQQSTLPNGFHLLKFQKYGYSLTKKIAEIIKNKMI